ncbi:unnamed protein product [Paramecium sonneborni]|uniref:Uncharacterized protein n=1 Tax=Paramecium sonneborni TaxID=65129 RepID=A0A8S1LB39_9CILI|nr:unnamed protein product [Paramecium sonneborni]
MGCLFAKKTGKNNYELQDVQPQDTNLSKNAFHHQPTQANGPDESSQNSSQQKLINENPSCLLTDSSSDDEEIYQIDEILKFRRAQLKKKRRQNKGYRHNSLNNLDKVFITEQNIKKRSSSLGQIALGQISINMLYYEKFQKMKNIQRRPLKVQIDSILIDINQQIEKFDQNNQKEQISLRSSFSSMEQLVAQCKNCKNVIENDQYQLECLHIFDSKCLVKLIIDQIQKDQTKIHCLCQQIIKTKLLKKILITNVEESEQYLQKLFANQYQHLEQTIE